MATLRQLTVNIAASNVWTQLTELSTGSAYSVPSGQRGDARWLVAHNLGANEATVEVALSLNSTITNAERVMPPVSLLQNEQVINDGLMVVPATWGVWARAVGTTPNVTVTVAVYETA